MNVGVVGNPSYRDLKTILAHLAQVEIGRAHV